MKPSKDFDVSTQCPSCGAQLVVNLRGHRQFVCGREDIFLRDDERPGGWYIDVVKPCRTSEIEARMMASKERWDNDPTREYFIIERATGEQKAGPFATFPEAMAAAKKLKNASPVPLRLRILDIDGEKFVAIP